MKNLSSDIAELFGELDGSREHHVQLELWAHWRLDRLRDKRRKPPRVRRTATEILAARRLIERNRWTRWKAEGTTWKKKRAKQTEYHNRWKTDPAWRRRHA